MRNLFILAISISLLSCKQDRKVTSQGFPGLWTLIDADSLTGDRLRGLSQRIDLDEQWTFSEGVLKEYFDAQDTIWMSNDTFYLNDLSHWVVIDNTDAQTLTATSIGDSLTVSGGNSIMVPHRLYGVDSLAEIYTKSFPLGATILHRANMALYKVQASAVSGYTTDSIAVIPTGGMYAVLQPASGRYDIRWFGAIADDATSDNSFVSKAVNYATTIGGNSVYIPAGRFILSNLQIDEKIHLIGESGNIIVPETNFTYAIRIRSDSSYVEGLNIVTYGVTTSDRGEGIKVIGNENDIVNCEVRGLTDALGGNNSNNFHVEGSNNRIINCRSKDAAYSSYRVNYDEGTTQIIGCYSNGTRGIVVNSTIDSLRSDLGVGDSIFTVSFLPEIGDKIIFEPDGANEEIGYVDTAYASGNNYEVVLTAAVAIEHVSNVTVNHPVGTIIIDDFYHTGTEGIVIDPVNKTLKNIAIDKVILESGAGLKIDYYQYANIDNSTFQLDNSNLVAGYAFVFADSDGVVNMSNTRIRGRCLGGAKNIKAVNCEFDAGGEKHDNNDYCIQFNNKGDYDLINSTFKGHTAYAIRQAVDSTEISLLNCYFDATYGGTNAELITFAGTTFYPGIVRINNLKKSSGSQVTLVTLLTERINWGTDENRIFIKNSAPTSGAYLAGDIIKPSDGSVTLRCTVSGDPGTWVSNYDGIGITGTQTGNIPYLTSGSTTASQDVLFYYSPSTNVLQLDQLTIEGDDADGYERLTAADGMVLTATNGLMVIQSNSTTIINDDANIGSSTSDQLNIGSTSSYAQINHEAVSGGYLRFYDTGTNDVYLASADDIVINGSGVSIGTTVPATSAALDIQGTTGAVIFPRLTTTQRNNLTPIAGMQIFNTTIDSMQYYASSGWRSF